MNKFVGHIRTVALALGAPGLFLVALLDSSFLPLPGITDLLLVVMVTRHPPFMLLYVGAATFGSVIGCLLMHYIGHKGGEALVGRHFATARIERAMVILQRHGTMAVLIPSILPPPAPFKIFVLLAGAAGISAGRFAAAIVIGRGSRYLLLGVLAVAFGDRALTYIRQNGALVSIVAVGLLSGGFTAYLVWRKAQAAKGR